MVDTHHPAPPDSVGDFSTRLGAFDLEQTARRIGHYLWIERQLFETIGAWIATMREIEVKIHFGVLTHHHASHAEWFHRSLPEVVGFDADRVTAPPNPELETFVAAMSEPADADRTIEKLVGVYRVLVPRKIAAYRYHLGHTSAMADGPTARVLRFVLTEEIDDWGTGEALVQSLVTTPDDVRRATQHTARLEALMTAAGGIAGPGTLGH